MQLPSSQETGTCTFTKSSRLLGTRLLRSSLFTLWLNYGQNCLELLGMLPSYVTLINPSFAWLRKQMNVGVGMQTSARIYFEYSMSIWSMLSMGESFLLIFGTFIHIEGLTVTYVV